MCCQAFLPHFELYTFILSLYIHGYGMRDVTAFPSSRFDFLDTFFFFSLFFDVITILSLCISSKEWLCIEYWVGFAG